MEKKSATPQEASPSIEGGSDQSEKAAMAARQRNLFLALFLTMTWQLAIVVIVPLVGGHWLDERYDTAPLWLLVGGGITVLGIVGVLLRIVREANQRVGTTSGKKSS